jgi:hypothetical protein
MISTIASSTHELKSPKYGEHNVWIENIAALAMDINFANVSPIPTILSIIPPEKLLDFKATSPDCPVPAGSKNCGSAEGISKEEFPGIIANCPECPVVSIEIFSPESVMFATVNMAKHAWKARMKSTMV